MNMWIVLPARGFRAGKTRLAGILDASARAGLNRRLFLRTAHLARDVAGTARVLVVTPDPAVRAAAADLGLATVIEPTGRGLNGALLLARAAAQAAGASHVLSLSCDLPLLVQADITALMSVADEGRAFVIAPDRAGTGTNALFVPATGPFRYMMGDDSARRHRDAAFAIGLLPREIARPGLQFDLDLPTDLLRWRTAADIAA